MQLHAATAALYELSTEAAELQARLAELALPLAALFPEAAAATLEHLATPALLLLGELTICVCRWSCLNISVCMRSSCSTALRRLSRRAPACFRACPGLTIID